MLPNSIRNNMKPTIIEGPSVKTFGFDEAKHVFFARIEAVTSIGGARSTLGTRFEFPVDKLKNGASLARMMTLNMRAFLKSKQCAELEPGDKRLFQVAGTNAVAQLRGVVEPYFAYLVLHRHENENGDG